MSGLKCEIATAEKPRDEWQALEAKRGPLVPDPPTFRGKGQAANLSKLIAMTLHRCESSWSE